MKRCFSDYAEVEQFMLNELPMFQKKGCDAYHPGLETSHRIDDLFDNPHRFYRTIHIGGTNGKGSTAHMLAAILAESGYKVGLYTSPHLIDFRERIKVNGEMISRSDVVDFINRYYESNSSDISPSFFELTTIMAFDYFRKAEVDFAVVKVGLGGRLDTTNIVTPILSIITNVSLDHTSILGHTCRDIASEKAGIIKSGVPIIIGEAEPDVLQVFSTFANESNSSLILASGSNALIDAHRLSSGGLECRSRSYGVFQCDLSGKYQSANIATVLTAIELLEDMGIVVVPPQAVVSGMANVCRLTGLFGRWSVISRMPLVVTDTGHNPGGWKYLASQISEYAGLKHLVLGFAGDKDVDTIMKLLSDINNVNFYFTRPSVERGLPEVELSLKAELYGIVGSVHTTVSEAYEKALSVAGKGDMIFVGGSGFVVSDLLRHLGHRPTDYTATECL